MQRKGSKKEAAKVDNAVVDSVSTDELQGGETVLNKDITIDKDNTPAEEDLDNPQLRWRKVGGGSFKLGTRLIKPNQVFMATLDEIPANFRDLVVPADKEVRKQIKETSNATKTLPPPEMPLFQVMAKAPGWYDVVNATTGKAVNEKALRQKDAETLLAELNA